MNTVSISVKFEEIASSPVPVAKLVAILGKYKEFQKKEVSLIINQFEQNYSDIFEASKGAEVILKFWLKDDNMHWGWETVEELTPNNNQFNQGFGMNQPHYNPFTGAINMQPNMGMNQMIPPLSNQDLVALLEHYAPTQIKPFPIEMRNVPRPDGLELFEMIKQRLLSMSSPNPYIGITNPTPNLSAGYHTPPQAVMSKPISMPPVIHPVHFEFHIGASVDECIANFDKGLVETYNFHKTISNVSARVFSTVGREATDKIRERGLNDFIWKSSRTLLYFSMNFYANGVLQLSPNWSIYNKDKSFVICNSDQNQANKPVPIQGDLYREFSFKVGKTVKETIDNFIEVKNEEKKWGFSIVDANGLHINIPNTTTWNKHNSNKFINTAANAGIDFAVIPFDTYKDHECLVFRGGVGEYNYKKWIFIIPTDKLEPDQVIAKSH